MKTNKLAQLLSELESLTIPQEGNEVMILSGEFAQKIRGAIKQENANCQNTSCGTGGDSNRSCTNTNCNSDNGMTNTGCTNTTCS